MENILKKVKDKMELKKGLIFDYLDICYYVQDILKVENTKYIVALNYKKPKEVVIFDYKFLGNVLMVKMVEDEMIIRNVLFNSLKKEVA